MWVTNAFTTTPNQPPLDCGSFSCTLYSCLIVCLCQWSDALTWLFLSSRGCPVTPICWLYAATRLKKRGTSLARVIVGSAPWPTAAPVWYYYSYSGRQVSVHATSLFLCGSVDRVTMTTDSSKNGAITSSRVNFFRFVGHVTIFSWMLATTCCLVVGLGLGLGLDLVFGYRPYTAFRCHCRSLCSVQFVSCCTLGDIILIYGSCGWLPFVEHAGAL